MGRKYKAGVNKKFTNSGFGDGGASSTSETLKKYSPSRKSAKADIDAHLQILRSRASDLSINTPVGSAIINTSCQYTIGSGLKVFPRVKAELLGMTDEEADEWNKRTSREFNLWANSPYADIRERNNFYDIQEMLYRAYLTDGDSFALIRRDYNENSPYTLRIQSLEGNRVSNPMMTEYFNGWVEMRNPKNGNKIINGIEINDKGQAVAYWISNKVPLDPQERDVAIKWNRVKSKGDILGKPNVLHICHDERAEQFRGIPYLAPAIETLRQISQYTTAELTSAIMRSYFGVFFTSKEVTHGIDTILPNDEWDNQPVVDPSEYLVGPASANALPKGVDVKTLSQNNAASTFEPFTTMLIKQVAAAIGQPYEVLMKCFNSSYSASRAALLQAWDQYKLRRAWFSRDFCQPVYEMWLAEAIAIGRIKAEGFFTDPLVRAAYCSSEWYGPAMSVLDPKKDMEGAALRIKLGVSSPEREALEMTGSNFDDNIKAIKKNVAQMIDAGLDTLKEKNTNANNVLDTKGGEKEDEEE